MSNRVDPDETAHMSRLIWFYAVCKSLLLSPVAVKELNKKQSEEISSLAVLWAKISADNILKYFSCFSQETECHFRQIVSCFLGKIIKV